MPIVSGAYQNPGWANGTTPAIDATELNAMSNTLECVPIANGGTGGTTVAEARNALGLGNTNGALPVENGGSGQTSVTTTDISVSPHTFYLLKWGPIRCLIGYVTKDDSSQLNIALTGITGETQNFVAVPTWVPGSSDVGTAILDPSSQTPLHVQGAAGTHYFTMLWVKA